MIRLVKVMFAAGLLSSFFMPWMTEIKMVGSNVDGWEFIFFCLTFGIIALANGHVSGIALLATAFALGVILLLAAAVLAGKDTGKTASWLFGLAAGAFLLHLAVSAYMGLAKGKTIPASLAHQLSYVQYGVFVGIGAAALLFWIGKASPPQNADHSAHR